ncbi:MAG: hypothetical protein M3Q49_02655, partial [Actinomycetota bacterium]|nr:hypothetical protein [Actinomycetota bacterium]
AKSILGYQLHTPALTNVVPAKVCPRRTARAASTLRRGSRAYGIGRPDALGGAFADSNAEAASPGSGFEK